jgi:peptidoglycan/xylan/chitin deacetylase (PgdA/CDA1 family)
VTAALFLGVIFFLVLPGALAAWIVSCVVREYRRDRVPILLYHRLIRRAEAERGSVRDEEMIWVVYDDSFAAQMGLLEESGYRSLDFDEYAEIRAGKASLPPKPIIITFDDGYESNYAIAYPELRRHGLAATIFVAPEPDADSRELIEGIDGFLSPPQMREMNKNRISIQSHGLTHCILTELDEDGVRRELTASKERLEEITGRAVNHLAIPRAGYNRKIRRLAKEAGYRTVCGNNKGSASGLSSLMALPRIVVERDMTLEEFRACLGPRAAVMLRIVGNLKRIPERIGGARFAQRVRGVLYRPGFEGLFRTSALKKIVLAGGVLYALVAVGFWVHLLRI